MKVSRLPKDPGRTGWNEILPDWVPGPVLENKNTADWLIIGAGFAGLSAAKRLKELRPKDRIVLLEASQIAQGPAGRNSGFMIDLPHDLASDDYGGQLEADRLETLSNRKGIAFAASIAEQYGLSKEAYDACGKYNGAIGEKGVKHNLDYHQHLANLGEESQLLDAQDMKELTGSHAYQNGLYTSGTSVIQPALYIRGLANGLRTEGVEIYENSAVLSLNKQGRNWFAKTEKGLVEAPRVMLTVNGHLNSFGFKRHRLMHVFTYASMTRSLTQSEVKNLGGQPVWGLTPAEPIGSTVRRISGQGGDRIVIRNRFTYDPKMEVSQSRLKRMAKSHIASFDFRFPALKGMEMEFLWGGRLCLSRNNVPVLEELEEGLFSSGCQNGLGTAKGSYGGKLIAELATGHRNDLPKFDQPRKLPPEPLAEIGANLTIRWKELRAGKEL